MADVDPFVDLKPLPFRIAYRLLGSVTVAEDVLQDACLRWRQLPRGGDGIGPIVAGRGGHAVVHRPAAVGPGRARGLRGGRDFRNHR